MLRTLIKKQFAEIFRTYFYDQRKNKARSKGSVIAWFLFFILIMGGVIGGMFASLSASLCGGLLAADMGWLYFALLGLLAILLGVFGSVFNTYSGLYLAKDNDLLLSLPIPVHTIMISRLVSVYLLGLMYSSVVFLPAVIVYWINAPLSFASAVGPVIMLAVITVIVMILSCGLGWVVAKISLKLKNKSFITVFVSLLFIVGYYFIYFKATDLIRDLIANASGYGEKIRSVAYIIYLFGRVGEGDVLAALVFVLSSAALFLLICYLLTRGFVDVAAASAPAAKSRYREKNIKRTSVSSALLRREFAKFTSSPNYMLNCGLGIVLLIAAGVLLLVKGADLSVQLGGVLPEYPTLVPVLLCMGICMLASMNDMATPSVSLEGKCMWISQSLPVSARQILFAKIKMQLILTVIPASFCCAAGMIALRLPLSDALFFILVPLVYSVFSALFDLMLGLVMPNLTWTNETVLIKQSGNVMIALFGGWGYMLIVAVLYLILGKSIGFVPFMSIVSLPLIAASVFLYRWICGKGAKIYSEL